MQSAYISMLIVYPLSTWLILQLVPKRKAAEKQEWEGATGNLQNKGNSDPFQKEGSIKMQLSTYWTFGTTRKKWNILGKTGHTLRQFHEMARRNVDLEVATRKCIFQLPLPVWNFDFCWCITACTDGIAICQLLTFTIWGWFWSIYLLHMILIY